MLNVRRYDLSFSEIAALNRCDPQHEEEGNADTASPKAAFLPRRDVTTLPLADSLEDVIAALSPLHSLRDRSAGHNSVRVPEDTKRAFRILDSLQYPISCSQAQFLEVICGVCGLGCTLNTIALAFAEAQILGRVLLPSPMCGVWLTYDDAQQRGCSDAAPDSLAPIECLIRRMTPCPRDASTPRNTL